MNKILLLLQLLAVAGAAIAQNDSATITMDVQDSSIEYILNKTGFSLFAESYWLKQTHRISIKVDKLPIRKFLDTITREQPIYCTLIDSNITVHPRPVNYRFYFENGDPPENINVSVKGKCKIDTFTNAEGECSIPCDEPVLTLIVTHTNIEPLEIVVRDRIFRICMLTVKDDSLPETVISTGFQKIRPERATGSFVVVSKKTLTQGMAVNILQRLGGNASGLYLNPADPLHRNGPDYILHNPATINGITGPLYVIDDCVYYGPDKRLLNLSPFEIESINILRDAAAASVYGAQGANGVIVITTKKGRYNTKLSFTATLNNILQWKPNLFYLPQLSIADYIQLQEDLFHVQYFDVLKNSPESPPIPEAVEILYLLKGGLISATEAKRRLDILRSRDVRNDLDKYLYRHGLGQQFNVGTSGGTGKYSWFYSGTVDYLNGVLKHTGNGRASLFGNNSFKLNKKLELNASILLQYQWQINDEDPPYIPSPYTALKEPDGRAAVVDRDFSRQFKENLPVRLLYNWDYAPLEEWNLLDNKTSFNALYINTSLHYQLTKRTGVQFRYARSSGSLEQNNFHSPSSYLVRNMQISFSTPDSTPIPPGGILYENQRPFSYTTARLQFSFDNNSNKIPLTTIAGIEVIDAKTTEISDIKYGYNKDNHTSTPVNYSQEYGMFYNPGIKAKIPAPPPPTGTIERYLSTFINTTYSFKNRIIISGSARWDASNKFGNRLNNQAKLFWSSGLKYNLISESISIRATTGINGNTTKMLNARTTVQFGGLNSFGLAAASINNPPNPNLSWEKAQVWNIGIDLNTAAQRLQVSVDLFYRYSSQLISVQQTDPTNGFTQFMTNAGRMHGKGIDVSITSHNLKENNAVQWNTILLFTMHNNQILQNDISGLANWQVTDARTSNAIPGYPSNSLFSYKFFGIDPANGDPLGLHLGGISTDYAAITNSFNKNELVYSGPRWPPYFGTLRNSFEWNDWTLSFMLSIKLGYYYRKNALNYGALLNNTSWGDPSYNDRWQLPGDEKKIPSLQLMPVQGRDLFFTNASIQTNRADNLRVQEIYLSRGWKFTSNSKLPLSNIQAYAYASNLGILWKATHESIDPDAVNYMPQRLLIGIGIKIMTK